MSLRSSAREWQRDGEWEREEAVSVPAGGRNGRVDAGWKFKLAPFN